MRRLARQQPALQALMQASAQLQEVGSRFEAYQSEAGSSLITHKQYLELNELAMSVLLQLDCTPCGVPELRAVRKRLAACAMRLLDTIQASFSAGVTASMEVPDRLVQEHLQPSAAASDAAGVLAAPLLQQQQQEPSEVTDEEVPAVQQPGDSEEAVTGGPQQQWQQQLVHVVLRVGGQTCDASTQTDPHVGQ
jgi:hypothetical protein